MAISNLFKDILNRMNKSANKVQLGTVLQNIQSGAGVDLARGKIFIGNSSGVAAAVDTNDSGKILVGDGTDLNSVAVSGDISLASNGAVTIANSAVETIMINADAVDGTKIADDAVSLEHLDSGIAPVLIAIAAEDADTMSREENVAGLASAIVLANSIKTTINLHYVDAGGSGEEHLVADTAIASADASDLASLITLVSEIQDSYVAHNVDCAAVSPTLHIAQGTTKTLASEVNPTNLQTCISVSNDIKAKLNDHMDDSTAHTVGDSAQEAAADAAYGAANLVPVANVLSGDIVSWSILNDGTGNVTGVSAVAGAAGITFTFSADPQNDAIISYCVFRAAV